MAINLHFTAAQKPTLPQNWMVFEKAFNRKELDKIEKDLKGVPFQKAHTFASKSDHDKEMKQRKSNIKWIPQNDKFAWIYEKLLSYAQQANNELWNFDIYGLPEMIQYTEYDAKEKGHYDWHQDIGPEIGSLRKISMTVQLSDEKDYEGGELEYYSGGPMDGPFHTVAKGGGTVFTFPSYMLHRVTPVTKGIRKSFVLWLGGSSYR